uniref:CX domain-containing protein n=1 Tax=Caenorhabditis tropicalis TaxID=1561998 RepID=A0A1I7UAY3_9PELO
MASVSRKHKKFSLRTYLKPKMFLLLVIVFQTTVSAGGESSTCSCPDTKTNHVSGFSFGTTLLSPSFSSLYFNVSSRNEIVIKEPLEPIWFNNNEYYWDNAYHQAGAKHTYVCSYHIAQYHKELRKIRYNSTHRPSNITFGCQWYQECCDLGCCMHSILQFVIFLILYSGIAVMLVSFCSNLPRETIEERRLRRTRAEISIFFPCQQNNENDLAEDYVLSEMVNREGPPKYDELYPNGSSYARPLRDPSLPPLHPLQTIEETESTETI